MTKYLTMLAAATAMSLGITANAVAEQPPNVLFIAIDDLNDFVGCLGGHPHAITPNIDALARRGTLFTNAHCQAPICGPSRASLMTGLRPSTTGIYGQIADRNLRDASAATRAAVLLPDYLEQHGYRTAGAGKIFHQGDRAKVFDQFGEGTNMGPKPKKRFAYDPAWLDDREGSTQTDWGVFPDNDQKMPDHHTANWVIAWLNRSAKQPRGKPFFLAAGFVRPHVPWYASQKYFDMHPVDELKMPPYQADDWDDLPVISKRVNAAPMMPAMDWVQREKQWPSIVQGYLACTTFADYEVGRVIDALQSSPYADNTYIVLWSDHGYHLGEKGRFAKQSLWERSSRVPLVICGPGLPAGQVCDAPVQLLDIYPTLTELLNLAGNDQNEGHSLVPLLHKPRGEWPHVAITTYGPKNHAIQTRRHRLIHYEDGAMELYDHQSDPHEWHNLAGKEEAQPVIAELRGRLPNVNADNAKGSSYGFNEYFRKALSSSGKSKEKQ